MHMNKNDWIGIGTSLVVHALLLLLLAGVMSPPPETEPIGYIAVDFGDFQEGRPVRRAVQTQPRVEAPEPEPEREQEPVEDRPAPPQQARPVDLPDQEVVQSEQEVQAPDTPTIAPETQDNEAAPEDPEPREERRPLRPLGGGAADGDTGETSGQQGEGQTRERSAPYQIEGLNRSVVEGALPAYTDKVNATIRVQIVVDPNGRIIRRRMMTKANPSLEQAVMTALQRWRFNPLPRSAPQDPQTGIVTFRFRLE